MDIKKVLSTSLSILYLKVVLGEIIAPVPLSVMLGEEARFFCSGKAFLILWIVNDVNTDFLDVEPTLKDVNGVLDSNLTLTGSMENNNASVQCWLVFLVDVPIHLPPVNLTVLGMGPVSSLTLGLTPCIHWSKPTFVSDDVTVLMYNLSVSGADLPSLNITTNDTQYCPKLTPCQEYVVTVTPFSTFPNYSGSSYTITNTTSGDNYRLLESCTKEVAFVGTDSVTCSFICEIEKPSVACPFQFLHIWTTTSDAGHKSETLPIVSSLFLSDEQDFIWINIPGLPPRELYFSNFSILDQAGVVVDTGNPHYYSTYSVQSANFSYVTHTNNVEVTCFFAFGAPASACMALFENLSYGLSFSGTVPHTSGSLLSSGVVSIPQKVFQRGVEQGLSSIVFDVTVYDVYVNGEISGWPAFEQSEGLEVGIHVGDVKPGIEMSSTKPVVSSTNPQPSSSTFILNLHQDSYLLLTVVIGGSVVGVMLLFVSLLMTMLCCYKQSGGKTFSETIVADATDSVATTNLSMESQMTPQTPSDIVCVDSIAYDVLSSKPPPLCVFETTNIVCSKSPAYETVSSKSPVYDEIHPKSPSGGSHYTELGPRPSDAPPILPELGGKKVSYSDVKLTTTTIVRD